MICLAWLLISLAGSGQRLRFKAAAVVGYGFVKNGINTAGRKSRLVIWKDMS